MLNRLSPATAFSGIFASCAVSLIRAHDLGLAASAAIRQVALALLVTTLLGTTAAPRAWDVERMTSAANKLGPQAVAGLRTLLPVLTAAQNLDDLGRLDSINAFFNRRIEFRNDIEVWGELDHWTSPLQLLAQGQGDCEDFAIAKYFSLLAIGVPATKLRLVYVRAQLGGPGGPTQAHMVLAYYGAPGAEPLVLDNLITDVRPASRRPDLVPVFSFNSDGLWQGVGGQAAGDPVARLSRWRDVLVRAKAEGFQ